MNNKLLKRLITIFTILCLIATIANMSFRYFYPLYLSYKFNLDIKGASSIGIIGSADGPTSILISNAISLNYTAIFAFLSIIGMTYLIIAKKKKDLDN